MRYSQQSFFGWISSFAYHHIQWEQHFETELCYCLVEIPLHLKRKQTKKLRQTYKHTILNFSWYTQSISKNIFNTEKNYFCLIGKKKDNIG